jgi:hypothetical protein
MSTKPLGTEPATTKSKRLDAATKVLQALIPMAGNAIIIDAPESIHFFSRLAYKYADELLKYEEVDCKDIAEILPKFVPQQTVLPAGMIKKMS